MVRINSADLDSEVFSHPTATTAMSASAMPTASRMPMRSFNGPMAKALPPVPEAKLSVRLPSQNWSPDQNSKPHVDRASGSRAVGKVALDMYY